MSNHETISSQSTGLALETNKLIRNTYTLLSMTLLFSALTAALGMVLNMNPMVSLLTLGGAMVLIWFVLPRTANSAAGLAVVFAITGLLGLGLGPTLNHYLALANGPQIVGMAFGGTGVIFLTLSGYALTTRKNFNFMGGFLITGLIVAVVAMLANIFLAIPALSLAISAVVIMLMSGFILYDTSRMIHEPHGNYLMMTVGLYLSIFNIFVSLLHLLGALSGRD
ncbi:MAG: Bax inhibitor-1/YccA family protein [Chromatiales bacterium]|nr:Bax inhibitor-1/YccA family protein [Gammaproteobacteria bacterium]MBW6476670.1 Bax inhibitor-1/YccA family protein [Chromatiales bacterium]